MSVELGSNTDNWSDEQVEALRKLWPTAMSTKAIGASLIPPRTKGAVIGKADRLKLGNKPKRRADMGQKQVRGYGIQVRAKPARKPKKEKKEAPQQKAPKVEVILVPVEPPPRPDTVIPTAALKNRMCRWPYGNPDEPDFGHCGCHTDQGVYCVTHHRVAYRPYVKNYKPLAPIKVNYGKRRA